MQKQDETVKMQIKSLNGWIADKEILESESNLSGFLSKRINSAISKLILDSNITIRNEQLLWAPSKEAEQELKKKGYELIAKINWVEITRWLHSELEPYYYIPHIKNSDWTVTKISWETLKSLYHDMDWWNEYEQMAVLSETLDMPADVLVFMINWF
jgi:hypothetical protein